MTRSAVGGKAPGHEYWSARPFNKFGAIPGKFSKRRTHKAERKQADKAVADGVMEELALWTPPPGEAWCGCCIDDDVYGDLYDDPSDFPELYHPVSSKIYNDYVESLRYKR